jgi:hypothetical protein
MGFDTNDAHNFLLAHQGVVIMSSRVCQTEHALTIDVCVIAAMIVLTPAMNKTVV